MNHALYPSSFSSISTIHALSTLSRIPTAGRQNPARRATTRAGQDWTTHEEAARQKRMRSLLALFSLYAATLLVVLTLSDGADIGCILGGIAGHVLYATSCLLTSWRDSAWLESARGRTIARAVRLRTAH